MPLFSLDAYLKTFINWESKLHQAAPAAFSIERVERLLAVFGNPEKKLRFAHVAGTKGKGSTCAFLASILRASGYRVGLYTSPHLYSLCERIRILQPATDGPYAPDLAGAGFHAHPKKLEGMISPDEIEKRLRYYHDDIACLRASGVEITFYELMTVLAASYFASRDVQIVVLETGLGGRLDATNVFETSVCGIAPIGFDHTHILGTTLAAIASEKAGIIRDPSQRVVLAPQPAEAMDVLQERCNGFGIRPMVIGQDLTYNIRNILPEGVMFDVEGRRHYTGLLSPMTGRHQVENAALAIGMAEDLEIFAFVLTEESVRQGISSVAWPARFERVGSAPTVIVDCAHTPESAAALVATFQAVYPGAKAVVVLGMSSDKDPDTFIRALEPLTDTVVYTKAAHPRAFDFPAAVPVAEALGRAKQLAGNDGFVLVTGSVFVCAEARLPE